VSERRVEIPPGLTLTPPIFWRSDPAGRVVPQTVDRFLALVSAPPGEGYVGTVFHLLSAGRYVLAGQAGSNRLGQVQAPRLPPNPELLSAKVRQTSQTRNLNAVIHKPNPEP
jgi:hypothetical protein